MLVAIVYSLPSKRLLATEYGETDEDSAVIAEKVALGLRANGFTTETYPISEDRIEAIATIKADCVFNLIEWCGQDIYLSEKAFKYLRALGIPVTGSSEELFVMTGDKERAKHVLRKIGIPTPGSVTLITGEETIPRDLRYPLIVKPTLEHCSTGLTNDSVVHNEAELRTVAKQQIQNFNQSVLAEEFIVGRELLVYLLQEKDSVRVLPIEEVVFTGDNPLAFQTYQSKWEISHPDYQNSEVVVAKLSKEEQKIVEKTCIKAFKQMGFYGYGRFDVRFRDNIPYVLETNVNSSVYDGDGSLTDPNEEVIPGIKFRDYLLKIVQAAIWHFGRGERV